MQARFRNSDFVRSYVLPAALLFAIPAFAAWFAPHAARSYDRGFLDEIAREVAQDATLEPAERDRILAFYRAVPPSVACADDSPELAGYREGLGEACSDLAQFRFLRALALFCIALGIVAAFAAAGTALASFVSRPVQYRSFVVGWNVMRVAGALEAVAQGVLATFLSFWVTAIWFELYSVKLVLVVGVLAVLAVANVVIAIFKRPPSGMDVEGEILDEGKAPELWARIRELCDALGTAPPCNAIGGIDDNFFVTEGEVRVGDEVLRGRTLFVSLSLLRILSRAEADAVLAHEMAHLLGGDTEHSKKLAPMIDRFVQYLKGLYDGVLSRPIFYFMRAYLSLFELSIARSKRLRELEADAAAARATSPRDIARSLLKIGAYSSYRGRVEEALFEKDERHSELGIPQRVILGFAEYARTPKLRFDLHESVTPHPFDSHPPLRERVAHVGAELPEDAYEGVLLAPVESSWVAGNPDAEAMEQRLWAAYEERFAAAHEEVLAYRYGPTTPAERAHVEKHFPEVRVRSKDGSAELVVDYEKLVWPEWKEPVRFEQIARAQVEERLFKKYLELRLKEGGLLDRRRSICLSKLEKTPQEAIALFDRYYGRHQVMTRYRSERER